VTIENREVTDEFKQAGAQAGGSQLGGGAEAADQDAAGGSSGTGGYGSAQNQANHQGQPSDYHKPVTRELSRGERYDLEQGGGRAADAIDTEDELTPAERERAELGQRYLDEHGGSTQQP